jgi:DNA replication protein DnaC
MTAEFPDAPIERIRRHLVGLRMPRALETLDHLVQHIDRGHIGTIEAIEMLLAEELTIRESCRIKAALQMARLSVIKTLQGFDFAFQPSLDRNRILALAQLDFIDRHEVVHLIGQSGTGKSHLAVALGVEAVRAGRSVYFSPLADIIDRLARADREGRLRNASAFSVALSCSSSMRSDTSPSVPAPAICSSSWSTLATRRARWRSSFNNWR